MSNSVFVTVSRFLNWRRQFHLRGACVLLIDMQEAFVGSLAPGVREALVAEQAAVIGLCAERGIPIVQVEYAPEHNGPTIPELQEALDRARVATRVEYHVKHGDDAFWHSDDIASGPRLEPLLNSLGATKLVIMGINATACVLATARTALALKYELVTSVQAIGSSREGSCAQAHRWFARVGRLEDSLVPLLAGGAAT